MLMMGWCTTFILASLAIGVDGLRKKSRRNVCGAKGFNNRIVNGEKASECEWTWQVGLRIAGQQMPFCGGMLIDSEWALTAAHCMKYLSFQVVAGDYKPKDFSTNRQIREAVQVIRHPRYYRPTSVWDLALIRVNSPFEMTGCVATVCLPDEGADVQPGAKCWITGWGTLAYKGDRPDVLQEAPVTVISNDDCWGKYDYTQSDIDSSMICAQGRAADGSPTDACQGDSGGPLVCESAGKWVVYGATSWGFGCGLASAPGIWARVHEGLGWIDETLEANQGPPPPPASCPRFAISTTPDFSGDCQCRNGLYCSLDGINRNCPTSEGLGGYGGEYFLPSCKACRCYFAWR